MSNKQKTENIGVMVAVRPKGFPERGFVDPLSYGKSTDPWPDRLLRDRGAIIFNNKELAISALEKSLAEEEADGNEWMEGYTFEIVDVNRVIENKSENTSDSGKHYRYEYKGIKLDPYRIAEIYGLNDHALFQAMKKILVAGRRGNKDFRTDITEARDALTRRIEMLDEDDDD